MPINRPIFDSKMEMHVYLKLYECALLFNWCHYTYLLFARNIANLRGINTVFEIVSFRIRNLRLITYYVYVYDASLDDSLI